jgi:hypothetical protein
MNEAEKAKAEAWAAREHEAAVAEAEAACHAAISEAAARFKARLEAIEWVFSVCSSDASGSSVEEAVEMSSTSDPVEGSVDDLSPSELSRRPWLTGSEPAAQRPEHPGERSPRAVSSSAKPSVKPKTQLVMRGGNLVPASGEKSGATSVTKLVREALPKMPVDFTLIDMMKHLQAKLPGQGLSRAAVSMALKRARADGIVKVQRAGNARHPAVLRVNGLSFFGGSSTREASR